MKNANFREKTVSANQVVDDVESVVAVADDFDGFGGSGDDSGTGYEIQISVENAAEKEFSVMVLQVDSF